MVNLLGVDAGFDPGKVDMGGQVLKFGLLHHAVFVFKSESGRPQQIAFRVLGMVVPRMQDGREIPGFGIGGVGHFIQLHKMRGPGILILVDELVAIGVKCQ